MTTRPSRAARCGVRVIACRCGTSRYRVSVRKVLRIATRERTGGIYAISTENRYSAPVIGLPRCTR